MEISQERIRRIIKEELADARQRRPDVLRISKDSGLNVI